MPDRRDENEGRLWDAVHAAESPGEILQAADALVKRLSERQDYSSAAECVMAAVDRVGFTKQTNPASEWLAALRQERLWEGLMSQAFFRNWLSRRNAEQEKEGFDHPRDVEADSDRRKHLLLSYREMEPRSCPLECEDDDALVEACDTAFQELGEWLAEHERWSLGGRAVLVAINRTRRRGGSQQLWNPAAFGLRFVDPSSADEQKASSLLSGVAQGDLQIVAVRLGVPSPEDGEHDVLG